MKQTKVLSRKQLPTRAPTIPTLVFWLMLDRFSAPGWLWGAVGVLLLLMWIGFVVQLFTETQTEIRDLL